MYIENSYLPTTVAINTNPNGTQPPSGRGRGKTVPPASLLSVDDCGLSGGHGSASTLTL